jgi:hypothetical protein
LGDLLSGYFALWGRGASALSSEFQLDLSPVVANSIGFLFGGLSLWAFLNYMLTWDRKGTQPQSITLKTADTPNQVVAKDLDKFLLLVLRVVLFLALLAVVMSLRS